MCDTPTKPLYTRVTLFQQKLPKLAVQKICHYLVWKNAFPWFSEFSCNISLFEIALQLYKGFFKIHKGKNDFFYFQFIYFKTIFKPKSDQCVELLRSRRFFRDQDRPYWLMSYFDVICVIRHQMTQMTSNDAYDIKMWHQSIWPILVSKEASWPQQFHLYIWFWLNNFF